MIKYTDNYNHNHSYNYNRITVMTNSNILYTRDVITSELLYKG